jgi:hypothetical protein
MRVRFVRNQGQRDRVYVQRSNGSEVWWSFPSYGADLPHDLVHMVVESAFQIPDGFWGRVDAGVDPSRVNADANRIGGKGKYAGFGDDLRGLYLAEALANLWWSLAELSDEERFERLTGECRKQELAVPQSVGLEAIRNVRSRLDDLRARWRALGTEGTLELTW